MPKLNKQIKLIPITPEDLEARKLMLEAIRARPDLSDLITKSDELVREQSNSGRPPKDPLAPHFDRLIYRMGLNALNTLLLNKPDLTPLAPLPEAKESERDALRHLIIDAMYTSHQNHNPDLDWVMSEPDFVATVADSLLARVILLAPPSTPHNMNERMNERMVETVTTMIIHHHYTESERAEELEYRDRQRELYRQHSLQEAEKTAREIAARLHPDTDWDDLPDPFSEPSD